MDGGASVAAVILVAAFTASAFAKATYMESTLQWFGDLWPGLRPERVAPAVIAAEAGIVAGLVLSPRVGGLVVLAWLTGASVVLLTGWKRLAGCGCFGRRQQNGRAVALRNTALLALSVIVAVAPATGASVVVLLAGVAAGVGAVVVRETMTVGAVAP